MRLPKTKTIRNKILLVFSLAFFVLLIVLFLVNRVFLVDYFISTNNRSMRSAAMRFVQDFRSGDADAAVDALTKSTGARVYLLNEDLQPIGAQAARQNALPFSENDGKMLYENASAKAGYFTVLGGDVLDEQTMVYALIFGNGTMLVLTKAMGLVGEASRMFFSFMMLSSVVVYLIGLGIIFLIARNLSRPVAELNRVTRKMANLEFDETLAVKGGDELAELTHSVNQMAGKLSGTIGALHQSNERLEKELSKERSLEKMRRRFVADVSHELKNPISVILGYADGLRQNVPKTKKDQQEYYEIIADEASGMNDLVKNLLDLSSYESGSFTLKKENFSLRELAGQTMERFNYIQNEKDVRIDLIADGPCELTADRLRMGQVLGNLLGNAFKYVDDHGSIRIAIQQSDEEMKLTVANSGPLIPAKELELIWSSFYQVNTQRSGKGLGLAIVKSIVELHGGTTRAYTEDGFNCFEVVVPHVPSAEAL